MIKEFVSYEMALALKELEYEEPCFTYYYTIPGYIRTSMIELDKGYKYADIGNVGTVLAPTYSQAFRWFRKKLLNSCICSYQNNEDGYYYYKYVIKYIYHILEIKHFKEGFLSYEEAEQACLLKLIEIIKNK